MKIAMISSSGVPVADLEKFLPPEATEIISVGEQSLDQSAKEYISSRNIKLTEFLLELEKTPLNESLERYCKTIKKVDMVLAFWDGKSNATKQIIDRCNKMGTPIRVLV